MATVTLDGLELNGLLPDVCVMCGRDADVQVSVVFVHLQRRLWWFERTQFRLPLPYCDRCWRRQRASWFGGHRPLCKRIDRDERVTLAKVADGFADSLDDMRMVADRVTARDDGLSDREYVREVRGRFTGSARPTLEPVRDATFRAMPVLLFGGLAMLPCCGGLLGVINRPPQGQPVPSATQDISRPPGAWQPAGPPGWNPAGPPEPVPPVRFRR